LLHGAGEGLGCEDADHGAVFDDGDELAGTEGGGATEGFDELVGGAGQLEAAGHDALEVAVAVGEEALSDGLAGDGADEAVAADDGEDVLEAVDGAVERALESVGAGEEGVLGEHDLADEDGFGVGGRDVVGTRHLRSEKHEAAEDDEPETGYNDAGDDHSQRQACAKTEGRDGDKGRPGELGLVVCGGLGFGFEGAGGRGGGKEVHCAEDDLHPDEAAQDVTGGDPGLREERDVRLQGVAAAKKEQADDEVGDGPGEQKEA
jgi:hypothetical protein